MGSIVIIIIIFLFGLSIGSFANVCIYRLPRKKSIANPPRSFCPHCGKTIAWYDNIPVLGFLLLRGKCRYCRASISIQYPLVELLIGLLFLGVYLFVLSRGERLILIPFYWYFCATLVILSVIDGEFFILPDWLTYPLVIVGFLLAALYPGHLGSSTIGPGMLRALIGALAGGLSLWLIGLLGKAAFKKEAMGLGDVKLMAAVGAWQGWELVLFAIFLGALVAAVVGITFIVMKKAKFGSKIPFGPYLAAGSLITLFFGWEILFWYLRLY
ncbi:MAG TPA: prepilin peptidase [Proteobacteria bacterium]|nr:prepilin peptidase [Pseudomonadota bacterium]